MSSAMITTAFIPVSDPSVAARWYSQILGLDILALDNWSAVLGDGAGSTSLTLLGPESGIKATPGLKWATCNFLVQNLAGKRAELERQGIPVGAVEGSADVCLFFTLADPDGNTLLLTDR
ncbi:VOC family protein [Arthrobacter pascens]|uniref:VOC family protein n=1 Tax=Arthrobacter pascens TaxID=1677 RepID=UPI0027D8BA93|nr:VOC family protein [Arthrobacter pascens]